MIAFKLFSLFCRPSVIKVLIVTYDQLFKAAVFLEKMYKDEHRRELKERLGDIFFAHLSQMCEIHAELASLGHLKILTSEDRFIIPSQIRRPKNSFERYIRDMIIIMNYRDLIHSFFILYNSRNFQRNKITLWNEKFNEKIKWKTTFEKDDLEIWYIKINVYYRTREENLLRSRSQIKILCYIWKVCIIKC